MLFLNSELHNVYDKQKRAAIKVARFCYFIILYEDTMCCIEILYNITR